MKFHKYQPYKKLKLQASEMPHHAKHHASSIAAIERSLVIRIRDGFEPRRGSVKIIQKGENDTTTDPLRGSYFVHIAITKLRVLACKDTCMVFRIIWHLRCLFLFLCLFLCLFLLSFQFPHRFSSKPDLG